VTDCPLFNAPVIAPIAPSTAFSEADLEIPADFDTTSTSSDLFTVVPFTDW